MIDEEKILKASKGYCDATYGTLSPDPFIAEGFRQGAQWAQEEFVKSLWHDASEEPKKEGAYILMRHTDGSCECFRYTGFCDVTWEEERKRLKWWKYWCYLSDILPQEGGAK